MSGGDGTQTEYEIACVEGKEVFVVLEKNEASGGS